MSDTPEKQAIPELKETVSNVTPEQQRVLNMITTLEDIRRTIGQKLSSPEFFDSICNRLIASDAFRPYLEQLIDQALERRSRNIPLPTAEQGGRFLGLHVQLHREEQDGENVFKVAPTGPTHPTWPNSFEAYRVVQRQGPAVQWADVRGQMRPDAVEAIQKALNENPGPIGEYRFAVLMAEYSRTP